MYTIILAVLAVTASALRPATTPVIAWASYFTGPSVSLNEEVSSVSDSITSALSFTDGSSPIPAPLGPLGATSAKLVVLYVERLGLTAQALADRPQSFADVLPQPRVEAALTRGLTRSEIGSIPYVRAFPCNGAAGHAEAAAWVAALDSSAAVVSVCVDGAEDAADAIAQVDSAARALGRPFASLYTGAAEEEPVAAAPKTTIWSGPVLSFLLFVIIAAVALTFAFRLLFSLKTQEDVDVPKQKQI